MVDSLTFFSQHLSIGGNSLSLDLLESWKAVKEVSRDGCMGLLSRWLHPASSSRGDGDDVNKQFVQLKDILPIDLRPYGVISRKYEYYPLLN